MADVNHESAIDYVGLERRCSLKHSPGPRPRRGINVTKAKLEGSFVDELARLQPTAGYMRLIKESVVQVWKDRQAAVRSDLQAAEQARKKIQQKLNRLDEAFLFERSIDIDTTIATRTVSANR